MNRLLKNNRVLSVAAFSCLFAYLLSFVFEGQLLYSLLDSSGVGTSTYILSAIIAHFMGLFSCGFFVKTPMTTKRAVIIRTALSFLCTVPFFCTFGAVAHRADGGGLL